MTVREPREGKLELTYSDEEGTKGGGTGIRAEVKSVDLLIQGASGLGMGWGRTRGGFILKSEI